MTTCRWVGLGLLLLAPLLFLAGCAAGEASRGDTSYYPYISDVPPSFYGNDPALRQWYTTPYWNPYASP